MGYHGLVQNVSCFGLAFFSMSSGVSTVCQLTHSSGLLFSFIGTSTYEISLLLLCDRIFFNFRNMPFVSSAFRRLRSIVALLLLPLDGYVRDFSSRNAALVASASFCTILSCCWAFRNNYFVSMIFVGRVMSVNLNFSLIRVIARDRSNWFWSPDNTVLKRWVCPMPAGIAGSMIAIVVFGMS